MPSLSENATANARLLHGYQRLTNALHQNGNAGSTIILAARTEIAKEMSPEVLFIAMDLALLAEVGREERLETHLRAEIRIIKSPEHIERYARACKVDTQSMRNHLCNDPLAQEQFFEWMTQQSL